MNRWWNRPAPGEGFRTTVDVETGRISEHHQEHIWLAPFRGVLDFIADVYEGRMTTADWIFVIVVVSIIARGGT